MAFSGLGLIPSTFRFGLSSLQPVEEVFTKRIGHLKFIKKTLSLRPSYSFEDYTRFSSLAVVDRLDHMPQNFEKEKLAEVLTSWYQKAIESDSDLAEAVESLGTGGLYTDQGQRNFHRFVSTFSRKYSEGLEGFVKAEMSRFVNSDLSFSLFDQLSVFHRNYSRFMKLMELQTASLMKRVSMYHRERGIRRSRPVVEEFKSAVRPMVDAADLARISALSLDLYIDICNSRDYVDIFNRKTLCRDRLDQREYERLFTSFSKDLREFDAVLIGNNVELIGKETSFKESVAQAWYRVAEVYLSGS